MELSRLTVSYTRSSNPYIVEKNINFENFAKRGGRLLRILFQ